MSIRANGRSETPQPIQAPKYQTNFIGRATDLAGLKAQFERSRMVSLIGPGGAGKTRLAAEAVRFCPELWPDGIYWVELVSVKDPDRMPWAVVSALGLPGRNSAIDVASAWLAPRTALIVLDNCEHLVSACASFGQDLLARCDRLTIIATSRETLGIAGEARWPVSSLTLADAEDLFESRAQLAHPAFTLDRSNHRVVAEICDRLDRLPLAIELAASRIGMMHEQEVLRQLSNRFQLLQGGARTAHGKLQTMRAAIEWSYQLLTEAEARLFRRLSVFHGGFTLESANAVCADELPSVLDLVSSLVQKSMVVAQRIERSPGRYRLLESQLAFAEDRLRESGELEDVQHLHYEYFCQRLESTGKGLPVRNTNAWIMDEAGNLSAALLWARTSADDFGLSLAASLPYDALGDLQRFRELLDDLLHLPIENPWLRVQAFSTLCGCAYKQGDFVAAIAFAESGLEIARDIGATETEAQLIHWIGAAYEGTGEFERARSQFEAGLSLISGSTNYALLNMLRNAMADLIVSMGDYATARSLLVECIATATMTNDAGRTASSLESLAWTDRGAGNHAAAAQHWKESLSLVRTEVANRLLVVDDIEGLSIAAEALKDDRRALRLGGAATRMAREMSYMVDPWWRRQYDESHDRSRKRLGREAAEEAWGQGALMTWDEAIDYALTEDDSESTIESGPLSRRELEVARLVAKGLSNRQIAAKLVIAERTAEGHVEHIRNKLGFNSRAEVAAWVSRRAIDRDT